jgi:hypothetical protein
VSISIFVLDVEEFRPLVDHAQTRDDIHVDGPLPQGYWRLSAQGSMTLERKALGFKPAVWHGLMTGGLIGRIQHFDNETLTLVEVAA